MRIALGIVAGLVIAMACVMVIEMAGHIAYPPPPGLDVTNPDGMARLMESIPAAALGFVAAAWFVGSLLGAWTANAIARRALAGWIVALLVIAFGVVTMVMIPHPAWMWPAGIGLPLMAGWLAQRVAKVPA